MPIETLHEKEDSKTAEVTFRWRGMTIYLVEMWKSAGKKSLIAIPANVLNVEHIPGGCSARWTIFVEEENSSVAHASTTSNGSAAPATPPSTDDSPAGRPRPR